MSAYSGIIKFGSGHPAILGESDLKSLASIQAVGSGSDLSLDAIVDSKLGAIGTTNGAVMLRVPALPVGINTQGQLSWRITTNSVTAIDPANGSTGTDRAGTTYHMTHAPDSGAPFGRLYQDVNERFNAELNTDDLALVLNTNKGLSLTSNKIHSMGRDDTVLMTMSWTHSTIEYYVDHVWFGSEVRALAPTLDMFQNIYLGSRTNGTTSSMNDGYFTDFVLSSVPVVGSANYNFKKLIMFGDSVTTQSAPQGFNPAYGNNSSIVIEAELLKHGVKVPIRLNVDGNSGATVSDLSANTLQTYRSAMLANNPDYVLFHGAINDIINWGTLGASFEVDLQDHINSILAVADKMVLITAPSLKANSLYDTVTVRADTQTANTILKNQIEIWNAANPTRVGDLKLCDMFKITNGENVDLQIFKGGVSGALDDLHYSALGQKLLGTSLAGIVISNW